jgi:hypothetical protein
MRLPEIHPRYKNNNGVTRNYDWYPKKKTTALNAKCFIRKFKSECVWCGNKFHPYVDFPLVYSSKSCTRCRPDQELKRVNYKVIPSDITKDVFDEAVENVSQPRNLKWLQKRKHVNYMDIFNEINNIKRKQFLRECNERLQQLRSKTSLSSIDEYSSDSSF